jgi:hypothetical protein
LLELFYAFVVVTGATLLGFACLAVAFACNNALIHKTRWV